MKKILPILLALTCIFSSLLTFTASAEEVAAEKPVAKAVYGSPKVDAADIDPIWDNAPIYNGDIVRPTASAVDENGNVIDTGTRFTFQLMWDEQYFYVLEKVTDGTIGGFDPSLTWQNDSTEICISLNNNKAETYDTLYDGWVGIAPHEDVYVSSEGASVIFGDYLDSIEYITNWDEEGYTICAKFDIKALNADVEWKENHKIGFEISVNDSVPSDTTNTRTTCVAWADATDYAYQNPSLLGTVYLVQTKDSEIVDNNGTTEDSSADASDDTSADASVDTSADASSDDTSADSPVDASADASDDTSADASVDTSAAASADTSAAASADASSDNTNDEGGFPVWIIVVIVVVVVGAVAVVVVLKNKKAE